MGKRIVVDTDVARAAKRKSPDERAVCCASVLDAMYYCGHVLVLNTPLLDQWMKNPGRADSEWPMAISTDSARWFAMMGSRGRLEKVEYCADTQLRDAFFACLDGCEIPSAKEDYMLVDAAVQTDNRVLSLDKRMRRKLGRASDYVSRLGMLMWVNPDCHDAQGWLEHGAPERADLHVTTKLPTKSPAHAGGTEG